MYYIGTLRITSIHYSKLRTIKQWTMPCLLEEVLSHQYITIEGPSTFEDNWTQLWIFKTAKTSCKTKVLML